MIVESQKITASEMPDTCTAADIRAQLQRIMECRVFADARRLQEFLQYVVEESLAGRASRIKGFSIAQDVFHKENPDDAQTSTVVRVEAGRLRRRLIEYYSDEGRNDPLRIEIPKGAYVPSYSVIESGSGSVLPASAANRYWTPRTVTFVSLLIVSAITAAGLLLFRSAGVDTVMHGAMFRPALAVLPFEDKTTDGMGATFAAGLTEDIITDFSKVRGLDVIALSSVELLQSQELSPRQIGAALGVSYVLRGDVRGANAKFRVTAQLYDAGTDRQLWADRFDRSIENMLVLQDELATRVVQGMPIGFSSALPRTDSAGHLVAQEARALYHQAMNLVNPPNDVSRLLIARQAFERCLEIDPGYANAYAGLAYSYVFAEFFGHSEDPDRDLQTAITLAQSALEIDPSVGLAYTTLAFSELTRRNFAAAVELSATAVQVQPGDAYVNTYHAYILTADGQAKDGVAFAKRAQRLDPLAIRTPYLNILAFVSFYAGEYQQSMDAHVASRRRGGPFTPSHQAYMAASNAALGQLEEAAALLDGLHSGGETSNFGGPLESKFRRPEDATKLANKIRQLRE